MASLLYDSIFNKILPLGESIILSPAHGAGSVCGSKISERTWTTIGLEKQFNPLCQVKSEGDFIDLHARMLDRPPYFRKMEVLNLAGPPLIGRLPHLTPLSPQHFGEMIPTAQVVDSRDQVSFGGGHIPGSLSMWDAVLSGFAGWFLDYDNPILFVCDPEITEDIVRKMLRMGFDNLAGYLRGGMVSWVVSNQPIERISLVTAEQLCESMKKGEDQFLLDIRAEDEFAGQGLKNAEHIHLTQLLDNLDLVPKNKPVIPLCRSGNRSMLAASILKQQGWRDVKLLTGGLSAWRVNKCDFDL
jgi:hydroxyacylglutathione hydrolase